MTTAALAFSTAFMVAIAAAQYAYRVSSDPVNEPWVQNEMEFVAWNSGQWAAWIHDGAFEQAPENSDQWSRHSKASIAFTGWDGEALQAKIDGDSFLIAQQGNWQAPEDRVAAIRYRDWSGHKQIRTVAELDC